MKTTRTSVAALLALVLLVGAACSDRSTSAGDDGRDRDTVIKDARGKRTGDGRKRDRSAGSDDTMSDATQDDHAGGRGGAGGGNGGGGRDPSAGGDAAGRDHTRFATASAAIDEREPDARKQGVVPGYTEVLRAQIEGLGEQLRMTLTFSGDVPRQMPDKDTFMVIGFGLNDGRDREQSWAFGAQATNEGWTPYAGKSGQKPKQGSKRRFPGKFQIDGANVVMTVPWSYVGGPRALTWQAHSGWFRQVASTSHFAYDPIPNEDPARYPN